MDKSVVVNKRKKADKSIVVKKRKETYKSIVVKKKKKAIKSIEVKKRSEQYCVAKNCNNKQYKCNESFYRFPRDVVRATVWAIECGREDLLQNVEKLYKNYKLCGVHFENKMFFNDRRKRLQSNALPTIFPSLEGSSSVCSDSHSIVPSICDPVSSTTEKESNDDNGHDRSSLTSIDANIPQPQLDVIEKEVLLRFSSIQMPSVNELRQTIKSLQQEIHELHRLAEECESRCQLMKTYLRPRLKISDISKRYI